MISVVIPTYNYGRYVVEAVESVLAQTYPDYEVIVVDDGSTDDTRQRLAPYAGRIRYVYQENRGLSAARNTGIGEARGDLVAFLDSDDLWHPRKLEIQARYLDVHPEVGLLATGHVNGVENPWPPIGAGDDPPTTPITFEDLVVMSRFGSCGVLARRACFEAVGLFDVELKSAEDRDTWVRIARHFPVVKLELPLWKYRIHGASMTRATIRMEVNVRRVLDGICRAEGARLRPSVRRRAYSVAAFSAAYGYTEDRAYGLALRRLCESIWHWPLPYPRSDMRVALVRPWFLAGLLRRLVRSGPGAVRSRLEALRLRSVTR